MAAVGAGYGGIDAVLDNEGTIGDRVFQPNVPLQALAGSILDPTLAKTLDVAAQWLPKVTGRQG